MDRGDGEGQRYRKELKLRTGRPANLNRWTQKLDGLSVQRSGLSATLFLPLTVKDP